MWLKRLLKQLKAFFCSPPSMTLECCIRGERETFIIYGSAGFCLKGHSLNGDRIIRKRDAIDQVRWQRIWDHLNPNAVLTWVDG